MPRRGRGGNKDAPEQAPPAQAAQQPGEDPCSSGKAAASSARKSSDSSISSGAGAHERRTHQSPPRRQPRDGLNERVFEQRSPGSIDKLDLNITVRGICADYCDNNVSPLLRFVQQAQEQLNLQLQDLRAVIGQKADANNVASLEDFRAFKASVASPERRCASLQSPRSRDADGGVAALVRLQELSAALQRKADVGSVPTLAQFKKLSATVDQKANAKDVPTLKDLRELTANAAQDTDDTIAAKVGTLPEIGPTLQSVEKLAAALEQKADAVDVPTCAEISDMRSELGRIEKFAAALEHKANATEVPTFEDINALRAELEKVKNMEGKPLPLAEDKAVMRKMQVFVAAAGTKFQEQIRELRQQVKELRKNAADESQSRQHSKDLNQDGLVDGSAGERWPGRTIGPPSIMSRAVSEDGMSDSVSMTGSMAGSFAGSAFGPEERAELKKIQAVVSAAGSAFSRDIKELRKQVQQLQAQFVMLASHKHSSVD